MEQKDKQTAEKFTVRTDLAIEAREIAREGREEAGEPDGVQVETSHTKDYELTRVHILTEQGSQTMGKPVGSYITLEAQKLKENDRSYRISGHSLHCSGFCGSFHGCSHCKPCFGLCQRTGFAADGGGKML